MKTKLLMESSAVFMALLGASALFFPQEISVKIAVASTNLLIIVVQIIGALYFSFAALNWMARANLIGGIYSKPVAIANFFHFAVTSITLAKSALSQHFSPPLLVGLAVYALFAIWFGLVLFNGTAKLRAK